jgi:uncharacterized oxidoreductase
LPDGIRKFDRASVAVTGPGREQTLSGALDNLTGLDILVNNAGGVRAGRLESVSKDEIPCR